MIRVADLSDAPEISRFVSDLASIYIGPTLGMGGLDKLLDSMNLESTITRMNDGYPHWAAVDQGAIVGVVAVKPPCHLYHLFVGSDHQRKGIGRLLVNQAFQSISDGFGDVEITVNASLNAVEVYRRFGFVATSAPQDEGGVRFLPMRRAKKSRAN